MTKKIAIVTGNYTGVGKAISNTLVKYGYEKPDLIRSVDFNLCKREDAERLIDSTIEKYGRLDLLVNNVGNYISKNISDITCDEWMEMLDSNLNSAFYTSQKALPELRKSQGRILNLGFCGLEKLNPIPTVTAYQVSKTALLAYTRGLARAEAANKVLINMISPGSLENTVEPAEAAEGIPIKRFGSLDEFAEAACFLINSDYITGQNLEFAGGRAL